MTQIYFLTAEINGISLKTEETWNVKKQKALSADFWSDWSHFTHHKISKIPIPQPFEFLGPLPILSLD